MKDATSQNSFNARQRARSNSRLRDTEKARRIDQTKYLGVNKIRNSIKSLFTKTEGAHVYTFVTIGVTTELVRNKVYPSLWTLYKNNHLPKNIRFFAFGRASTTKDEMREKFHSQMHVASNETGKFEEFWKANNFYIGSYLARIDYDNLNKDLMNLETNNNVSNRLFYISVPNSQLDSVIQNIRMLCQPKLGWTRVIAEKPFGKDSFASTKITQHLLTLCSEDELYLVDEYLGKEIVQNILTIRFCNLLFSSTWNRKMIESVLITIKDPNNNYSKGKAFENYGIICDMMQLHVLQLLALIAMEKPISMKPDDIRDEKVKLLKCILPICFDDVILGQSVGNSHSSEDATKFNNSEEHDASKLASNSPTFCTAVLKINNERWDGVPFIVSCGKSLDERLSEIRIRYQNVPADIFESRFNYNELIIQVEPEERLFMKAVTKAESLSTSHYTQETVIPIGTHSSYKFSSTPDPYDNIIFNVFNGAQSNFIRTAELKQAWRIVTPLLDRIEKDKIQPIKYMNGSAGPPESDRLVRKYMAVEDPYKSKK